MTLDKQEIRAMTLGEIAVRIPGATSVFRHHDLDFCCAGNRSFHEATDAKGIDPDLVIAELQNLAANSVNPADWKDQATWEQKDRKTLIDFIVSRFHETHREQFPELIQLAARVEKVHAAHPLCPKGLADHLSGMFEEMSSHMEKEEIVLFPMLAAGSDSMARAPISVMKMEHEEHGQALHAIRRFTQDHTLPQEACNTWRALYRGLEQLEEDLMEHIHLENNILFVS